MAGLDGRRQSDFISMLQEIGKTAKETAGIQDPVTVCTETIRTIQMVSDSLLLRERDQALSQQPYSGCIDTLVAKTKAVSITVSKMQDIVKSAAIDAKKICSLLGELAEGISIITETGVQAVFVMADKNPKCSKAVKGVIDNYPLARGRLAIQLAVDGFSRQTTTAEQTMAISAVIATHLEALREQCNIAGEAAKTDAAKIQFKACAKGLSGIAAMLVAGIKEFVRKPSPAARQQCLIFSKPLLETVDALLAYVHSDDAFTGTPPKIPAHINEFVKPIQAAALSVCSASCLFVGSVKSVLTSPKDATSRTNLARYASAVEAGLTQLTAAVRDAAKAGIVLE